MEKIGSTEYETNFFAKHNFSSDNEQIYGSIIRCFHLINEYLTKQLKSSGVTAQQFLVLASIHGSKEGKLSFSEIGRRHSVSRANMSGILSRLEKNGFIYREEDPNDRRVNYGKLTEKARKMIDKLDPSYTEAGAAILKPFKKQQRVDFLMYLTMLRISLVNAIDAPSETSANTSSKK